MIDKIGLTEIIVLVPVILAGIIDFKTMKIPNYITFPFIIIAFFYSAFSGNFKMALMGFIVSSILGNIFFIIGGMGGGDVKLMAGIATVLGMHNYFNILLTASIIGAVWGIILILSNYLKMVRLETTNFMYQGHFFKEYLKSQLSLRGKEKKVVVPFGTCLAMATMIYFII